MHVDWSSLSFLLSCSLLASTVLAADWEDKFEARVHKDAKGATLPYRLFKPEKYDAKADTKYPLVLFLHGAGERGVDNKKQLVHGMKDCSSDLVQAKNPCFIVAPQCPTENKWVDVPWSGDKHTMPEKPASPMQLTLEALAALQKEFSIDADRLYVTGLSMGGFGTWDAIQRHPQMFAAAIPICGGGDTAKAKAIIGVPVWAFHGSDDTAVKVERTRDMIKAMQDAGGTPKYTEYPKVGHNSWSQTYASAATYEWLFAQKRKGR